MKAARASTGTVTAETEGDESVANTMETDDEQDAARPTRGDSRRFGPSRLRSGVAVAGRMVAGVPRGALAFARRRTGVALAGLGIAAAVLAAVLATTVLMTVRLSAVETARVDARAAAEASVVELLSYDYRAAPEELAGRNELLTGSFKDEYAQLMEQTVLPLAVQQRVTTRTGVTKSSIISDNGPDEVRLLVFLNQTTLAGDSTEPVMDGSRVRMTLQRVDGSWLVSELTPV